MLNEKLKDRPYEIHRQDLLLCRQTRVSEKTPLTTRGQEHRTGKTAPDFHFKITALTILPEGGESITSNTFIKVDEVAETLGISKSYAYKIVQRLNAELKEKGYLTIAGRVNKQYFMEKTCYGAAESHERK